MKFKFLIVALLLLGFLSFYFIDIPNISIAKKLGFVDAGKPGKEIYDRHCRSCHGHIIDFVSREWPHKPLSTYLQDVSTGEIKMEGMPSFSALLSEKELNEVVDYILEWKEEQEKSQNEWLAHFPDIVTTERLKIKMERVVSGLHVPWDMSWLPNGEMLITERSGKLFRVNQEGIAIEILGLIGINSVKQGGLHDLLIHPDFNENRWIYLSHAAQNSEPGGTGAALAISRYTFDEDVLKDHTLISVFPPYTIEYHLYGGRMVTIGEKIFITVGDRKLRDLYPQDLTTGPGKIHRLNFDGTSPADNPFIDSANVLKSIYSYGHRNPQGLAVHPVTGDLWSHEHGPRGGDELNIIEKGGNYGWPVISYGTEYDRSTITNRTHKEGMIQPVYFWTPSIAPSGMVFVSGKRYPAWEGNLLIGSLREKKLIRCTIEGGKVISQEDIFNGIGRVRNVKQGPDGYIYVAFEKPGIIFRLVPVEKNYR